MRQRFALPAFPLHPFTGLTAIGFRRNGAPIWPVMGGSGEGDPPTPPTVPTPPVPQPAPTPADPPSDPPADPKPADPKPTETVDFWKAKARDWEARSKTNSAAANKLAEIEEAQKTAEQKAAEAHAAAVQRAAAAEAQLLRFRVAAKAGLDADLAERLRGDTEEELLADAEALKAKLAPVAAPKTVLKPDPSQGPHPEAKLSVASGRDLWAQRHPTRAKAST